MTTLPVTIQERVPLPAGRGAMPGAAPTAGGFTPADIIRILRQRMFLIIFVWIFVAGATVGLTYYLQAHHQKWRTGAIVRVESPVPKAPMTFGERTIQVDVWDRYVADQLVLVKDNDVLMRALQAPQVRATQWYQAQEQPLLELRNSLGAAQIPQTNFFQVSMATHRKEDAPVIVNAVVERYIGKVESLTHAQYAGELNDYQKQEELLKERLDSVRRNKLDFVSGEMGTAGVTEGLNVVGEMWRTLADQVTRLEAEKLQYKAAYENLIGVDPNEIAVSPQMMLMIQQDPHVQALQNMALQLDLERMDLLRKVGPNHRSIQDLESRLDAVQAQLDDVMAAREKEVRDYEINSARTTYLNAIQAEVQLRERMQEAEYKQRDLDRHLAQYRILEEDQYLLEEQLNQIRAYINQLRLVIKDQGMVRVSQVGPAREPLEPSFPRWELFLPGGGFLGLLLAVGLAILLELIDTSLKTTRDVVRLGHMPILGPVADVDDDEVEIERPELAVHTAPRSMVAEAFRTIRTNLLLSSPADRQRTLLITSARPEEGRTMVAVNLAASLAQSGRRVLLIDANFHRPALRNIFPQARKEGLSNALIGQSNLDDLVSGTELPNVDVLTTGPIPPNPTELLAGSYFHKLLADAAGRYDQVILDGPPVLLMSDALVMTGAVDGVILVCRAKKTSRGVFQRARDQIERVNGRIFGTILNAARISRGGYFREQIRTFYDYQPEEALQAEASRILPGGQTNNPEAPPDNGKNE